MWLIVDWSSIIYWLIIIYIVIIEFSFYKIIKLIDCLSIIHQSIINQSFYLHEFLSSECSFVDQCYIVIDHWLIINW